MFTAYVIISVLLAIALTGSATANFVRYKQVLINMDKAGVPESWISLLGILKVAGALGLLVGIAVPLVGTAAAIGLILFFLAALVTHVRAHFYSFGYAGGFLLLAVAALVLGLASYPAPSEVLVRWA